MIKSAGNNKSTSGNNSNNNHSNNNGHEDGQVKDPSSSKTNLEENDKTAESWSIGTYIRLKPPIGLKKKQLIGVASNVVEVNSSESRSILEVDIPEDADPGLLHSNESGKIQFEYDYVFDTNVEQAEIFDKIVKDKVLDALEGVNCTIFAYGQTGSGKTYTIFGGDSYPERGIIPRTISLLFEEFSKRMDHSVAYRFEMSFTEVYKESVYDLLDPNKRGTSIEQWTPVQVMETDSGLVLRNINVFEVTTEEDALKLFFLGNSNRMTVATSMNSVSSRSHAVFTIIVKSESVKNGKKVYTSGKINLVDLAGSERMYKTINSKEALTEAKSINLSLHYLEQVVVYLREQAHNSQQQHIPYRNSVLTNMLRDSLGGNCRSCFILTLSLDRSHFSETISTCRFGQRCGEIKVQVHANSEVGLSDQIKELTARVKMLERQVAAAEEARNKLSETLEAEREEVRKATTPRTLTVEEKAECKACVQALFASAKEIAGLKIEEGSSEAEVQAAANAITQSSQEQLYQSVQAMNKNILVELCIALGGLVQSMYVEREKAKIEEANRAAKKASKAKLKNEDGSNVEDKKKVSIAENSTLPTNKSSLQTSVPSSNSQSMHSVIAGSVPTVVAMPRPGTPSSPMPSAPSSPAPSALTQILSNSATAVNTGLVASNGAAAAKQGGSPSSSSVQGAVKAPASTTVDAAASGTVPVHDKHGSSSSDSQAVALFDHSVALGTSPSRQLTAEEREFLTTGAQFTKVSRSMFGAKHSRWVHLSNDFRCIVWKSFKGDQDKKSPTINLLRLYTSVEIDPSDKEGCGLILRGPSGNHLHLIASSEPTKEQNVALANKWADALRVCIEAAASQTD